jgi:hypothetical protein
VSGDDARGGDIGIVVAIVVIWGKVIVDVA